MFDPASLLRSGRRRAATALARVAAAATHRTAAEGDAVFVLGPPRAGTTWLMESLCGGTAQAVFEPLFPKHARLAIPREWPDGFVRLDSEASAEDLREYLSLAARGRLQTDWTRKAAPLRHSIRRRTVVKEVRLNRAAGWLYRAFPSVPTVLIVRHPLPVVESMLGMRNATWQTWNDATVRQLCDGALSESSIEECLAVSPEPAARLALFAAVQMLALVDQRTPDDSLLIDYESLRTSGLPEAVWNFTGLPPDAVGSDRPSIMASLHEKTLNEGRQGRPPSTTENTRTIVLRILEIVGLDFYGDDDAADLERLHGRHRRGTPTTNTLGPTLGP